MITVKKIIMDLEPKEPIPLKTICMVTGHPMEVVIKELTRLQIEGIKVKWSGQVAWREEG